MLQDEAAEEFKESVIVIPGRLNISVIKNKQYTNMNHITSKIYIKLFSFYK